jgi:glycosyltransferase involved in cell wall biosynthesis
MRDAIDSVLAQTFAGFELVIIDDGSTDGSPDIAAEFARRDPRVRVASSEGRGLAAALNTGTALAGGQFIARQDADDTSAPDRFARQVEWFDRHPSLAALGTATTIVDEGGRSVGQFPLRYGAVPVRRGLRAARATPVHGSMMMRRDCLDTVGGYREAFATSQDFDLWLRLSERFDIDNLAESLYRWRLSADSVYGTRRRTQLLYCGIALAFAAERARFRHDSYEALREAAGDLDAFAARYRLRGLLHAIWGELLLRGLNDAAEARRHLALAVRLGHRRPQALLLWAWTSAGLGWFGSRALRA